MLRQSPILVATALAAFVSVLPNGASAREPRPAIQLAMMDMMPLGDDKMAQPAPGGATPGMAGKMGDDKMPMGGAGTVPPSAPAGGAMPGTGGTMAAQGQN